MIMMTALTIFALFFDDIRVILLPKSADNYVYSITLFTLLVFTTEIVL